MVTDTAEGLGGRMGLTPATEQLDKKNYMKDDHT